MGEIKDIGKRMGGIGFQRRRERERKRRQVEKESGWERGGEGLPRGRVGTSGGPARPLPCKTMSSSFQGKDRNNITVRPLRSTDPVSPVTESEVDDSLCL